MVTEAEAAILGLGEADAAVVVLEDTAENFGAGMLAKMAEVVIGTAGPSFPANGSLASGEFCGILI